MFTATWSFPKCSTSRGADALDGIGIPDVGGDGEDLAALVGQSRRVRPEVVLVDVGHDDTHAGVDEGFGDGQPDAAGRTGDDRRPSLQLLHGGPMVPEGAGGPLSVPRVPPVGDDGGHDGALWLIRPTTAARRMGPLRKALPGRKVDEEGELLSVPLPLNFIWLVLGVLTVLEALNDIFGVAGPDWLYDNWVHNVILGVCAALVLARAAFEPVARKAWLAFGIGLLLWFIGSAAWARGLFRQPPTLPTPRSLTRSGWRGIRSWRSGSST